MYLRGVGWWGWVVADRVLVMQHLYPVPSYVMAKFMTMRFPSVPWTGLSKVTGVCVCLCVCTSANAGLFSSTFMIYCHRYRAYVLTNRWLMVKQGRPYIGSLITTDITLHLYLVEANGCLSLVLYMQWTKINLVLNDFYSCAIRFTTMYSRKQYFFSTNLYVM